MQFSDLMEDNHIKLPCHLSNFFQSQSVKSKNAIKIGIICQLFEIMPYLLMHFYDKGVTEYKMHM